MIKFIKYVACGMTIWFAMMAVIYISLSFAVWEFVTFDADDMIDIRLFVIIGFWLAVGLAWGIINDEEDGDTYEITVPEGQRLGQAIMNAYRDKWYVGSDARGPVHKYWDIWEEDDEKIQEAINNISK